MNQNFLDSMVTPFVAQLNEAFEDLKACHEYYCNSACVEFKRDTGGGHKHTMRCVRMQAQYGLEPRKTE